MVTRALLAVAEALDGELLQARSGAHKRNSELVLAAGKRMVDLTPAARRSSCSTRPIRR